MSTLTIIPLILLGIAAVFTFYKIGQVISQRKFSLAKVLKPSQLENETSERAKYRFIVWLTPSLAISEAQNMGFPFEMKHYIREFLKGFIIGLIIMYVFYRHIPVAVMGAIVVGFIIPNLKIYQLKKAYHDEVKTKLISYFKRYSSALRSFDFNVPRALDDVIKSTEEPIRSDLEKVLFDIRQGASVERAYTEFNHKYNFKGVQLFHDVVTLVVSMGTDENNLLRSSANKFSRKKYWQNKLQTSNAKHVRESKAIGMFSLAIIFMIMFATYDFYIEFVSSPIGKGTMTMCIVWYVVTIYNINKHSTYDPTEMN